MWRRPCPTPLNICHMNKPQWFLIQVSIGGAFYAFEKVMSMVAPPTKQPISLKKTSPALIWIRNNSPIQPLLWYVVLSYDIPCGARGPELEVLFSIESSAFHAFFSPNNTGIIPEDQKFVK